MQVALEGGLAGARADGAHDDAKAGAGVQPFQHFAQAAALLVVLDLARDADLLAPRGEHQETARHGQVGGQERALAAGGFLDHLHQHFLPGLQHLLHERVLLALGRVVRGVVVFGVHLVDLEEAVFFGPVVDEGGLKVGVDVVDDAAVDVALGLGLVDHLHVVFLDQVILGAFLGKGDFHLLAGQHADEHPQLALFRCHAILCGKKCKNSKVRNMLPCLRRARAGMRAGFAAQPEGCGRAVRVATRNGRA